jgi:hypothetical protein
MLKLRAFRWIAVALPTLLTGCLGTEQSTTVPTGNALPTGGEYLLTSEPEGALGVREIKQNAQDGDEIVVVGRIGGEKNPWVEGLAAFNLVETELQPCNEIPGDNCPTPWDYCCEPDLADYRVLVQVVDQQGKTVPNDARELLGVKELQTLVVRGAAKKDDAGNVTVLAKGIFVRPQKDL